MYLLHLARASGYEYPFILDMTGMDRRAQVFVNPSFVERGEPL